MPRAEDVANYLLSLSKTSSVRAITPLKLQKLIYYTQGWHMAFSDGEPLFDDNIMAWDHGPVVPELYRKYKHRGSLTIKPVEFDNTNKKGKNIFSKKQINIINAVWEIYGEHDGKYLEELTHQETPWLTTRRNGIINKQKIFNYFKKLSNSKSS